MDTGPELAQHLRVLEAAQGSCSDDLWAHLAELSTGPAWDAPTVLPGDGPAATALERWAGRAHYIASKLLGETEQLEQCVAAAQGALQQRYEAERLQVEQAQRHGPGAVPGADFTRHTKLAVLVGLACQQAVPQ